MCMLCVHVHVYMCVKRPLSHVDMHTCIYETAYFLCIVVLGVTIGDVTMVTSAPQGKRWRRVSASVVVP